MDKIKVSIIVPVYNAELTIDKCIDTLINQTYHNIEILLIDDGSIDSSLEKCRQWEQKDSRITLVHKENEGVSATRNIGIQKAAGDYITFVDSDDFISKNAIEIFINSKENSSVDIIFAEYAIVDFDSNKITYKKELPINSKSLKEDIITQLMKVNKSAMMGTACRSFIRKQFLIENKIYFDRNIQMSEDHKFILTVVKNAQEIKVVEEVLYYYIRYISGSVTQRYMKSQHMDMIHVDDWKEREFSKDNKTYPELLMAARTNSFIASIRNINRPFTPMNLFERFVWLKENINNEKLKKCLRFVLKNRKLVQRNVWIGCVFCYFHFGYVFVLLHAIHNKTMYIKKSSYI